MRTKTNPKGNRMITTKKTAEATISPGSKHSATIMQTDKKGHVWVDTITLALELGVSPYSWSSAFAPQADQFYGDRNLFRRVHGRRALWNFTLIDRWYRTKQQAKTGPEPRYLKKLRERGVVAAA